MNTFSSPRAPSTLVGRERELGVLREHLDAAMAGQGSLVLIGGEAGIGKTALAEAVCREAEGRGALVLVGRCYDLTETPPYGPWIELFDRLRTLDGAPSLPGAFATRGTVGEVVSQAALFQQVLDFFTALSDARPLVLLLDDLHWADTTSLDLLRVLARTLAPLPLLVIVAYRMEEITRHHPLSALLPLLEREAAAHRLHLRPLPPAAVRALVDARYPLAPADAERLTAYLTQRAEGNVFFALQLLRALEEEEAIHPTDDGWALADLDGIGLPLVVRQVIDARIARLDAESQRLLTIAAVIGHECPYAMWANVARIDEETVLHTVEQAAQAGLLAQIPDGEGVRFAHALIRDAIYAGEMATRRRRLHRAVAEALAPSPRPDPDAVAYHFQQAADPRAVSWLIAAGYRAQDAYAWPTAVKRFEAALSLLEATGENPGQRGWLLFRIARLRRNSDADICIAYLDRAARLAADARDDALAAGIQFARGVCRVLLGDHAHGLPELAAGVDAIEALTPGVRARLNEHSDMGDFALVRGILALHLALAGRFAEAEKIGKQFLVDHPAGEGTGSGYGEAAAALLTAYLAFGRVDEARRAYARAAAAHRRRGDYFQLAICTWYMLQFLQIVYETERVAERHAQTEEAAGLWRLVGGITDEEISFLAALPFLRLEGRWLDIDAIDLHGYERSYLFSWAPVERAILAGERGNIEAAWATIWRLLPDGPRTSFGTTYFFIGMSVLLLAAVLACDANDLDQARAWLEALDRWLEGSRAVLWRAETQALWARYYRQAGDPEQARAHAERALAQATEPRQPLGLLAVHRLVGELEIDAKRYDDAEQHLGESLALADACQAPYERALTLVALAELHAATGMPDDARHLLDEAQAICEPLDARPALARIAALRIQLDAAPAPPTYPAGLSTREVEVLRLVAQGMTDAEAAGRLFLSPRTVGQHLRSVYNKLGVSSRAAATRFAVEHGLT